MLFSINYTGHISKFVITEESSDTDGKPQEIPNILDTRWILQYKCYMKFASFVYFCYSHTCGKFTTSTERDCDYRKFWMHGCNNGYIFCILHASFRDETACNFTFQLGIVVHFGTSSYLLKFSVYCIARITYWSYFDVFIRYLHNAWLHGEEAAILSLLEYAGVINNVIQGVQVYWYLSNNFLQ
jgi:hypothetical protein